ncbi:MAG: hypothetical protein ABJA79_06490 [Parafilimonas sp.]
MSGYIQIEINGKPVGLKFTMWAIEEMNRLKVQYEDSLLWKIVVIFYAGYVNNCRHKKEQPEFSLEDIELIVDDLYSSEEGQKKIVEVSNAFTDSYLIKSMNGDVVDDETKKKKQIGKVSMSLPLEK